MTATDPLLQPFQLRHLTLRNRVMSTAHEPAYSDDGMPKQRYRLYHVEKARGGAALTMTAGSAVVSRDSPPAFGNLLAYRDEIVPWLRELADECHGHGTAVMIQLTHLGRRTGWNKADWLPVLSASPVREPAHRAFPKTIEHWDIERIIADYASAAQRMQAAGLDGLEIEAYGHLADSFWSPATNRRTDEYAGSLDNRMRFSLRVVQAMRAAVGPDFLLGLRMVADEDWELGLSREDGVEIARRFKASGLVDFLNIIRGHIEHDLALVDVIPLAGMRSAPHLDFAGEVRSEVGIPVFHAARIADIATARHAIASGKLDMVGMTRALLADPHIVAKVRRGEEQNIRPCVGATYCLDRIYEGYEALCIHNPATGREATMPQVIPRSSGPRRRVVVVGAGPAGLEAARVAAERGHSVVVFEATEKAGGQILLVARAPRRRDLIGIVDWRMAQLGRLGVDVRFSTYAAEADVLGAAPDVVFVATGGVPDTEILASGNELLVSSWDVISGQVKPAPRALVFDDNGTHPAMQAAEALAEAGSSVEIVSPERFFAPEMGGMNHALYARAFNRLGVRVTINARLRSVRRDGNELVAVIGSDYGARTEERRVDQVVVEHGTLPADELYQELLPHSMNLGEVDYDALVEGRPQTVVRNAAGKFRLLRIGDAVHSRNIHAAVYDGLRFAKDLLMRHVSVFPRRVVMRDPVWIAVSDGTKLAARIWLPEDADADKVPAILEYLPYRRRDGTAARDYLTHPYFAGHGYACVRVDMRGTGDSDGVLLDEYLKLEQDDCLDVIAWIARQPWCTGAVGMIGISWGGFNGLQVAARQPPALKAIISLCSTDDRYADDVHYMGGALLTDNLRWASTMFGYQTRPPDPAIVGERWREMWLARLHAEPLMLAEWLRHPTRDDYWKHGSVCEAPEKITAATYLVGGWADAYSNAVPRMLQRLSCPRKGLIGPWAHKYPHFATPAPAIGFLQEALRWWDCWLKDIDTGIMDGPQYRVWIEDFVRPATDYRERPGRWIAECKWPAETPPVVLSLGDHVLGVERRDAAPIAISTPQILGDMSGAWCAYGSGNEQPGDQRADDGLSVVFDSPPLDAASEILGAPVLDATITSDKPEALLIARLCDVAPDGASLRVSYGVLNLTHRDSHEAPTPLPVGEPVRVRLQLNDCAHAFPPGHRIRLALSTTYWPTVWPSPEPATLMLDPQKSSLVLPHRRPSPDDGALPAFPEPEAAPPLPRTFLEPPVIARTASHDQISGRATFEVHDDTGLYRIDTTGLEYRLSSVDRFTIHPDDPLSARAEITFEMRQGRGDWQVRSTTRTVLTATATEYHVHATLDAWEGEHRLISRNWSVTVPRTLV